MLNQSTSRARRLIFATSAALALALSYGLHSHGLFAQTQSYEAGVEGQVWQQLTVFGRGIDAGNERPITTQLLFPPPPVHGGIADIWPCTTTAEGFPDLCFPSGQLNQGPGVPPDTAQNYGGRFAPCLGNQCYASGLIGVGPATTWANGPCVMRENAQSTDCFPSGTPETGNRVAPANGQLAGPLGIGVDNTNGTIYVTDHWNHRVQAFLFDGTVLSLPNPIGDGIAGVGPFVPDGGTNPTGERLNAPESVKVDASRNIIVGDSGNGRVAVFDKTGKLIDSLTINDPNFTPGDPTDDFPAFPSGIAITPGATFRGASNPPGSLVVVSDKYLCTIYVFDATTLQQLAVAGGTQCTDSGATPAFTDLSAVDGVSIDRNGHIYAADYYRDRVEIFKWDGTSLTMQTAFGDPLDGAVSPFALHGPTDVMVDHQGLYTDTNGHQVSRVWVVDSTNQRLAAYQVDFTPATPVVTYLFQLNAAGDLNGFPTKIAEDTSVDPVGKLVTTDPGNARIQRFQVPDLAIVNAVASSSTRTITFDVYVPVGKPTVSTITPIVCPTSANTTVSFNSGAASASCLSLPTIANMTAGTHVTRTVDFVTGQTTATFDVYATGNPVNNVPKTTSNVVSLSITAGCATCTVTPQVVVPPSSALEALTPPTAAAPTLYIGARTYATQVSLRITANSPQGVAKIFFKFIDGPETANITASGLLGVDVSGTSAFVDVPFRLAGTSTLEFWATNTDGTETAHRSARLTLDLTPPSLEFRFDRTSSPTATHANNPLGWWNSAVSLPIDFTGTITEVTPLGAAMAPNPPKAGPLQFTTEGRNLGFRVTVTAVSGLTTTRRTNDPADDGQAVNIDMTPPAFVASPAIVLERTSYLGAPPPANSTALATDPQLADGSAGSGVNTVVPTAAVANFAYGNSSVSFTATDVAGNASAKNVAVTVRDTVAPVITCPANYSIVTGAIGTVSSRPGFSISDASMINAPVGVTPVTVSQSPIATTTIAVNTSRVVTLTATDPAGLTASCTTTVTALPPHFTSQPPATQTFEGSASMPINLVATAVDATGAALTVTNNAPAVFPVGATTVTFTARDSGNQAVTVTTVITITDTTAPAISSCAAPLALTAGGTGPVILPSLTSGVIATDYSALTVTQSPAAGTSYLLTTLAVQVVPVTFTVKDARNNTSTCQTNVTITFGPPHFTRVPPNQNVNAGATLDLNAIAVDATGVAVTVTDNRPATFPLGTTVVTFTARDVIGQTVTATVTIVVSDSSKPVIAPHGNVTVEATSAAGAIANYTPPQVTDNLDAPKPATCTPAPTATFPFGNTTVNCTATDSNGNLANPTSFVVTVVDTTKPVIAAHADVTAEATGTTTVVSYTSPATSDAVDGPRTAACLPASGTAFAYGNTTVTCKITDAHGNIATPTTFVVHVVDTTAPVIAPHADITASPTSASGAVVTYTVPTATDAFDGTKNTTCTPASGSTFPAGNTTVTCRITDSHGNVATPTTFVVHVVDTTAPVVTVPANMTVEATGPAGAAVTFVSSATDNTGSLPTTCTPASGSIFQLGPTVVTCSATDASGNRGQNTFTITVRDSTPPAITVPANITVTSSGGTTTVVTFTSSAVDLVSGVEVTTCSPASGSGFPIGPTTVTCRATDDAGNTGSKSFTVTVGKDTIKPVVTVPANMTVEATSANGAAVTFTATALDNGITPLTPVCSPASGAMFAIGSRTVTCTATDASGNKGTASFTVTVKDTTKPVITVPANITVSATSASGAAVTFSPAPSATDAVTKSLTVICLPFSGSTFPIGTTTVTCGTIDKAGNIATKSFTVTVVDNKAPVITSCAAPVTIYTVAGTPTAIPDLTDNVSATDYSDFSVTQSPAAGTKYTLSATQSSLAVPVTLTVTDASAAHNSATCATVVTFKLRSGDNCHGAGGHGHHDGDGCLDGHHGHYDGDECGGRDSYHHDGDGHGGGRDGGWHWWWR